MMAIEMIFWPTDKFTGPPQYDALNCLNLNIGSFCQG
jgi:hypothetical protein